MRVSLQWILRGLVSHFVARAACCLFMLLCSGIAFADLAPENVAVVVNGYSEVSKRIAEEYVRLRDIPACNVIEVKKLSNTEKISVEEFRSAILLPVLHEVELRGLTEQIELIAYSAEIPTAIEVQKDAGEGGLPQALTPVASINGLTFLHQLVARKDVRYLDLNVNQYARRIVNATQDSPWSAEELQQYAAAMQTMQQAVQAAKTEAEKNGDKEKGGQKTKTLKVDLPAEAATVIEGLTRAHPNSSELHYNFACLLALSGQVERSMEALSTAVRNGWWDHRHTSKDEDLRILRERRDFKELLEQMKSVAFEVQPSVAFDASAGWNAEGAPVSDPTAPRYLLSVVLACTTGRGLSEEEAIQNLRRSAKSDATRPSGTIYFERNGDVRSTTREWAFQNAAKKLKAMGIEAVVEDGVIPKERSDVAGAVVGIADFDWKGSHSTILPGAIVEHLTSFGGVMTKGAGQTPLTEFLKHGAAGASGTVTEPYAIQAKFPSPFIHVFYAEGCTLAEAFYQSVTGPYQLLIVGDPLANPWRKPFEIETSTPIVQDPKSGQVRIRANGKSGQSLQPAKWEVYVGGRQVHSSTGTDLSFDWDPSTLKAVTSPGIKATVASPAYPADITIIAHANNPNQTIARLKVSLK